MTFPFQDTSSRMTGQGMGSSTSRTAEATSSAPDFITTRLATASQRNMDTEEDDDVEAIDIDVGPPTSAPVALTIPPPSDEAIETLMDAMALSRPEARAVLQRHNNSLADVFQNLFS